MIKLYYNDDTSASNFFGFSDRHKEDSGSDVYYGLVSSWNGLTQSLDFFSFTTDTASMTLKLVNTQRSFKGGRLSDQLATYNFANRKWELFTCVAVDEPYDDSDAMLGSGIISGDITYDDRFITFNLIGNEARFHKKIPANVVDSATYPNAPTKNVDKPIPIAYGDFSAKTDIGTIPNGNAWSFNRYKQFQKSAFPAIITDEFDVGIGGSEAKVDSQAIHTMDDDNVFFYNKGYYPTLTGTVAVTRNPLISFSGTGAAVYIPLSSSGFTTTGSGTDSPSDITHTGETQASDGNFDNVMQLSANSSPSGDHGGVALISQVNLAKPKVPSLGGAIGSLYIHTEAGNSTAPGTEDGLATLIIGGTTISLVGITNYTNFADSLERRDAQSTPSSWDAIVGTIAYKLTAQTKEHIIHIAETGVVVNFTLDEIAPHKVNEAYEVTKKSWVRPPYKEDGPIMVTETIKRSRTRTINVPAEIDYLYCSGKGRAYGAWVDADSRNNGYDKSELIENPVFMIESILRSELGTIYTGSATSTTSNKLVDSGASFATSIVGQTLYNITDETSAMVTARDSATTLSIDANIMASTEDYIIGGLPTANIDHASFDAAGNTSDGDIENGLDDSTDDIKIAFSQAQFIDSEELIQRLCQTCVSYVFIGGDGKFKIKTLRQSYSGETANMSVYFDDINVEKITLSPLNSVRNKVVVNYDYDHGLGQTTASTDTGTDGSTSYGTTVNGYNQTLTLELDIHETLDTTTAGKIASAHLNFFQTRRPIISFVALSPRYNALEIGDTILFKNWDTSIKIYGTALHETNDYYMVTSITKFPNKAKIEVIKVS